MGRVCDGSNAETRQHSNYAALSYLDVAREVAQDEAVDGVRQVLTEYEVPEGVAADVVAETRSRMADPRLDDAFVPREEMEGWLDEVRAWADESYDVRIPSRMTVMSDLVEKRCVERNSEAYAIRLHASDALQEVREDVSPRSFSTVDPQYAAAVDELAASAYRD